MLNLVGKTLGRYKIVDMIGEGGMAKVYKAFDDRLERHVAVKVILSTYLGSPELYKRFEREAKALAQLSHPNIVNIHDYGEQDSMPYLVMEYLAGGTLKEMLGEPFSYEEAVKLVLPIARALSYAHDRDFIHRDIKPANILLTEVGQPMLSDFGIAKKLVGDSIPTMTKSGLGLGTPDYMAPEQGLSKKVDCRVDIYALGIVFFELITGKKPYYAKTPMAVVLKHVREPFPNPSDFVHDLPGAVERIILKAAEKQPGDRYQDMETFSSALEELIYGVGAPAPGLASASVPPVSCIQKRESQTPAARVSVSKKITRVDKKAACPRCRATLAVGEPKCPRCGITLVGQRRASAGVPAAEPAVPAVSVSARRMKTGSAGVGEWKLVADTGKAKGAIYKLGAETKIGRSKKSDIRVNDVNASRRHACIKQVGENYQVIDLGSSNGTMVNGKRISQPTWLQPDDKIVIGDTLFTVQLQRKKLPPGSMDTVKKK